jgi:hypothetical protein
MLISLPSPHYLALHHTAPREAENLLRQARIELR